MLDSDLAELYGVSTSALNQQMKRNPDRFPDDFAFELTEDEFDSLLSQFVTANAGRGGRRSSPRVFTEHGVAMLSSVLRGERAAQVNVAIMRTFIKLRELLAINADLARGVDEHDEKISILIETVQDILNPPLTPQKEAIGFKTLSRH
jgi:hypothetical protein